MPKVSIIVPVHNSEKTLRRCIESALRQDFEDFELILMDDGSSDKSASIINEYRKQDNRVRGITRANAGVSSARNRALARDQADGSAYGREESGHGDCRFLPGGE